MNCCAADALSGTAWSVSRSTEPRIAEHDRRGGLAIRSRLRGDAGGVADLDQGQWPAHRPSRWHGRPPKPPSMLTSCSTWSGRTSLWSVSDASTRALIAAVTRAVALSLAAIRRAPSRYAVGRDSVGGRGEAKFRAIAAAGAFTAYHGMPRPGYAGHSCT